MLCPLLETCYDFCWVNTTSDTACSLKQQHRQQQQQERTNDKQTRAWFWKAPTEELQVTHDTRTVTKKKGICREDNRCLLCVVGVTKRTVEWECLEGVTWGKQCQEGRVVNRRSEMREAVVRKGSCSSFPSGFSSSAVGNVLAYHTVWCGGMEQFLQEKALPLTHTQIQSKASDLSPH